MDGGMLDAAGHAFLVLMDPLRLLFLATGVVLGLILGILPGIGGVAGTALLLPFTFDMDPYMAFAFLLGLGATTATGDPIPAILFGVPGGAGSAATVLDGLPMAKRGEAGRALSAAYMSSLMGGVFGAVLMGLALPVMRPLMLYVNSPELLAFSILGISMVAVLSGNTPLRGLVAGAMGVMAGMIGSSPQTGATRWTFDTIYLWDGLPLVPVVLGLFALPELCDLAIRRTSMATGVPYDAKSGMWLGAKDCFRNWWLVLRCSWIGAAFGAVPGIGGSVVDWLAYGHAVRTEKGARESFGKGDVRGVIASESSNNAKEGGALIPTIAFGIPGSSGMAILLGAFLIHGLVPGPDMFTKHLDISYAMVWSIALANILGAGLCYAFSSQFGRIAILRYTLVLPAVLAIIYVGAYIGTNSWGDLYTLLAFGVLGWTMKRLKWPRPPLILGFILGEIIENYLFISLQIYGMSWVARPIVIVVLLLAVGGMVRPLLQNARHVSSLRTMIRAPRLRYSDLFHVLVLVVLAAMFWESLSWDAKTRIVPTIVGSFAIILTALGLLLRIFGPDSAPHGAVGPAADPRIHMDLESDTAGLSNNIVFTRAGIFFAWLLGFMASMALIGVIPTTFLFVIAYMRFENKEPWRLAIPYAVTMLIFVYVVFDRLLAIPWPQTVLGQAFPVLLLVPSM